MNAVTYYCSRTREAGGVTRDRNRLPAIGGFAQMFSQSITPERIFRIESTKYTSSIIGDVFNKLSFENYL